MMEEDKKLRKWQRKQFSHVGLVAVCFMLVTFLAQAIMAALALAVSHGLGVDISLLRGIGLLLITAVPMYAIAFPVTVALMGLVPKCGTAQKEHWGLGKFMTCLVIAMGVGLAGGIIGRVVELLRPWDSGGGQTINNILANSSLWVNVVLAVLMAPVVEELLFRKMVMDRLLGFGQGPAIIISGLMFGLAHGNFTQFFYAFGIGLVWAYMYAKTGRVVYTIASHMIFNLFGGVIVVELGKLAMKGENFPGVDQIGYYFRDMIASLSDILMTGYSLLMVGCLIGGIIVIVMYHSQIRLLPGPWPVQKKRGFQTMILNVGMIAYILICLVMFLLSW